MHYSAYFKINLYISLYSIIVHFKVSNNRSQAWNLSPDTVHDICVAWRKTCRTVLDLPYRTHNVLIPLIMDQDDLYSQICKRFKNMFASCMKSHNKTVQFLFNHSIEIGCFIGRNVQCCNNINVEAVTDVTKVTAMTINELLKVRDGTLKIGLTKDEVNVIIDDLCLN